MNDDTKLLLVGAGQLGSRYLQGLAHVDTPVSITAVDPSLNPLVLPSLATDKRLIL